MAAFAWLWDIERQLALIDSNRGPTVAVVLAFLLLWVICKAPRPRPRVM
jgi:hypothetical protein